MRRPLRTTHGARKFINEESSFSILHLEGRPGHSRKHSRRRGHEGASGCGVSSRGAGTHSITGALLGGP